MRRLVPIVIISSLAGCSSNPPTVPATPSQLHVIAGDGQNGIPGYRLTTAIEVKLVDDGGGAVFGDTVRFAPDDNTALAEPAFAVTDSAGIARTYWRLGGTLGAQSLRVSTNAVPNGTWTPVHATASSNYLASLDGGNLAMCGIDVQGNLGCWVPPSTNAANPPARFVPVASSVRFSQVRVAVDRGVPNSPSAGCALAQTGRPWCFTLDANANVVGLTELAGTYPAMTQIVAADEQPAFCGLAADGQAWCWGSNSDGQLGDGTTTDRASPVAVASSARFVQIDLDNTACGVTAAGAVWCWGRNTGLEAGVESGSSVVPTQLNSSVQFSKVVVNDWSSVTCAIALAGGLYCWGGYPQMSFQAPSDPGATSATPVYMHGSDGVIDLFQSSGVGFVMGRSTGMWYTGDLLGAGLDLSVARHLIPATIRNLLSDVRITHGQQLICGTAILGGATLCPTLTGMVQGRGAVPAVVGVPFP
jgi:regulator of chromosome condensation (RCC1) repeat-containing protein